MTGETYYTSATIPGDAVTGVWTDWTPVCSAATTAPATSNSGRYTQIGKCICAWFKINFTGSAGSGRYWVSVPVLGVYGPDQISGYGWLYDSSAQQLVTYDSRFDVDGTKIGLYRGGTTNYTVGDNNPWVWANGDVIFGQLNYEAV